MKIGIKSDFLPWLLGSIAVVLGLIGCESDDGYASVGGNAMGTSYEVVADCPVDIAEVIGRELEFINQQMSTYREDSLISLFNKSSTGVWFSVSDDFFQVLEFGLRLSENSEGSFDVTAKPLINLWGFGSVKPTGVVPDALTVEEILANHVGHQFLETRNPPAVKKNRQVSLDLSAIAKGYGIDRIAESLISRGCSDFLIELGGEIRTHGLNKFGKRWRIAIENPSSISTSPTAVILNLSGLAVATSGHHRNFIELDGERFSHLIDARTGFPVANSFLSVTVVSDTAMSADGYATVIAILGEEAGFDFADKINLAVFAILEGENGVQYRYNDNMLPYLDIQ